MVKCLIRIRTKVNVHLRMINHCYRDVRVRVLTMGPRLLGNVLGALPIIPSIPDSSSSSGISISPYGRTSRAAESLHDSGLSISQSNSLASSLCDGSAQNNAATLSDESNVSRPAFKNTKTQDKNVPQSESSRSERVASSAGGKATQLGKCSVPTGGTRQQQGGKVMSSVAWIVLAMLALMLSFLLLLFALTESELDAEFLKDIRENSEFQQFHYNYFCPLRRWLACTLRWMGGHLIKE